MKVITIGQAREVVRRYQISRQGFSDFSVSQDELNAALDLIASGNFLSDDKKDHPNARILNVNEQLTLTQENDLEINYITHILKNKIAIKIAEMLIAENLIKFEYKQDDANLKHNETINHLMNAKLIIIQNI